MLNEYYTNISFKQYLKRYGVVNTLRRGFFTAFPFHFVGDYEIKKMLWQTKASKLIDKYVKYQDEDVKDLAFGRIDIEDPIWIFWNTGIETAPDIVKKCFETVMKYYENRVVVLSDSNLDDYICMPESLNKKLQEGTITMAHYADLVRFALLEHFGGLWLDATIFLSGEIPGRVFDSDFFVMQNSLGLIKNPVLYPVWFIRAKKNNNTIRKIRNVAFSYYENNNHVIEYLVSNIIMGKIIDSENVEMPYMNSDYSEYLVKCLGDEYNKEKLEWIFELTPIHKLTYKLNPLISTKNTVYLYLCQKG